MSDEYSIRLIKETIKIARETSVGIQLVQPNGEPYFCSGVNIGDGLVLTVQHALTLEELPSRIITTQANTQFEATIIERTPGLDLLLLKINDSSFCLPKAKINTSHNFRHGEALCFSPSYPSKKYSIAKFVGSEMEVTDSSELANDPYSGYPQYQFVMGTVDKPLHGNSGSGIFTTQGELVGILRGGSMGLNESRQPVFPLGIGVFISAIKELRR